MNLNNIIQGCRSNDRKSQEQLYRHYFPMMMSMCLRYTSDREKAAEIVNDGLLKVFTKIEQYGHNGSFEGWVRRIVFRSLSDTMRKDSNYLKFMVFDEYELKSNHNALDNLYEADILKLLSSLPRASREVFVLYAIQGYSHKEIAKQKGISVGTSKWHLSEARKRLQKLILQNDMNKNAG